MREVKSDICQNHRLEAKDSPNRTTHTHTHTCARARAHTHNRTLVSLNEPMGWESYKEGQKSCKKAHTLNE